MQLADWLLLFEFMYNVYDYPIIAILGQRKDKKPYMMYYARKNPKDV